VSPASAAETPRCACTENCAYAEDSTLGNRESEPQTIVLPPSAGTWDVFISYAHEDDGDAKRLGAALKGLGWSVWIDDRLQVGKSFSEEIQWALEASRSVIVLWSQFSVKSEWVLQEAGIGKARASSFP